MYLKWTVPSTCAQKNPLVATHSITWVSLCLLGAKIKPKSFRDQSADLKSKKYLAAFEPPFKL